MYLVPKIKHYCLRKLQASILISVNKWSAFTHPSTPPASLKINAFHLQPTLKLVLGHEQFAVSRILGFFIGFYISKCNAVLNLDLLTRISTSSKSIGMETPAFLICICFKQFSVQCKKKS